MRFLTTGRLPGRVYSRVAGYAQDWAARRGALPSRPGSRIAAAALGLWKIRAARRQKIRALTLTDVDAEFAASAQFFAHQLHGFERVALRIVRASALRHYVEFGTSCH